MGISLEQVLPGKKIAIFSIFNEFIIDIEGQELEIQIHDRFYYMLNDFLNYTQFELKQLVNLKSSYSKNVFRLLKQFESTNFLSIYIDEFRRILCIPESYKMSHIDQKVLNPVLKELSPLFPNLKLEKIKDGKRIKTLKFTWQKNSNKNKIEELEISKKLAKAFEQVQKNRFIKTHLLEINKIKLVKLYKEEDLITGLKYSKDIINKEFKTLNYLIKVINTGIEGSIKKIVIKEESSKIEETKSKKVIKPSNSMLDQSKADITKWCLKNRKYNIMGQIEFIKTFEELGEFIDRNSIEIE